MEAFLIGIAGKTEKEAALTTMHEYRLLVEGWEKKQRTAWETARWQTWYGVMTNPYVKGHNKPRTPKALMRFPWEEEDPEITVTPDDIRVTQAEADCLNRIFGITTQDTD